MLGVMPLLLSSMSSFIAPECLSIFGSQIERLCYSVGFDLLNEDKQKHELTPQDFKDGYFLKITYTLTYCMCVADILCVCVADAVCKYMADVYVCG